MYEGMKFHISEIDLHLPYYGGNKVRKLMYAGKEISEGGYNAIVTTGGIQSNHCRVTALYCAEKRLKCVLVLHGDKDSFFKQKGNALLMRMSGAGCHFVKPADIGDAMDAAMNDLKESGDKPFYLHGGGHNRFGVQAYIDAIELLEKDCGDTFPGHIFVASGTGSTQAGLLAGLEKKGKTDTQVHGISVARGKKRGREGVLEALELVGCSVCKDRVLFYDDYLFGGYGKSSDHLTAFINKIAAQTGIIVDPCYTGKALFGMMDLARKYNIAEEGLLFWHTGGILNLMN